MVQSLKEKISEFGTSIEGSNFDVLAEFREKGIAFFKVKDSEDFATLIAKDWVLLSRMDQSTYAISYIGVASFDGKKISHTTIFNKVFKEQEFLFAKEYALEWVESQKSPVTATNPKKRLEHP